MADDVMGVKAKPLILREMPSFGLRIHAQVRLRERSLLTPEEVLSMLGNGRCVWLSNPDRHFEKRAYVLIYSSKDEAFYVLVVGFRPGKNDGRVVTILTREQFEKTHRWSISNGHLLRAMRASDVSQEEFDAFRATHPSMEELQQMAHFAEKRERAANRLEIFVDYTATDTNVFLRESFPEPPGHDSPEVAEDCRRIADRPGFWQWLAERMTEKEIPVERVLALKVGRGVSEPVNLELS